MILKYGLELPIGTGAGFNFALSAQVADPTAGEATLSRISFLLAVIAAYHERLFEAFVLDPGAWETLTNRNCTSDPDMVLGVLPERARPWRP